MSDIVYIGAPEASWADFRPRAVADFPDADLGGSDDRLAARSLLADARGIIAHHFQFDETLLAAAPRLAWIQSLTTGTDAILRLRNLRPEVRVTSTRGMHGPQMSELVFLHMLALLRDFPRMLRNQAARRWERWPQPLLWRKTAVIVGVGAISEALAPRCKAFGMTVYGVSNSSRVPEGFDRIFPRSEITRAAALADFLILVVPYSTETENLVDEQVIGALPPHGYLINVARGGVLDEQALLRALREHRIAGAALDVFRDQPLPPEHPLWREDRVLISPLLGGMSNVYLEQAYPIVRQNLGHFLAGRPEQMINRVTRGNSTR